MKIVIIGAGLGGLTFAAEAVRDGHEVVIYDKNSKPGGVVALLEHEGYKFEQGPLLIGDMLPGEPIYDFLAELGINLETVRADRDIIMPDYHMITPVEYGGPYWRRERLKGLFPEDSKGIDAYYRFYDDVMHLRFIAGEKPTLVNKIRLALAFLKIKKYSTMSADELTRHFFKSEKIRTLYNGIWADFCADPSEAEGLGVVFTNFETAFDKRIPLEKNGKKYYPGYCYIKGGCQKLPEALADYVTSHGGKIVYNTVVDKVLVEEEESCARQVADACVICHNEKLAADLITFGAVGIPPRLRKINVKIIEIVKITAHSKRSKFLALFKNNVKFQHTRINAVSDACGNLVVNDLLDLDSVLLFRVGISGIHRRAHNIRGFLGSYVKRGIGGSCGAAGNHNKGFVAVICLGEYGSSILFRYLSSVRRSLGSRGRSGCLSAFGTGVCTRYKRHRS